MKPILSRLMLFVITTLIATAAGAANPGESAARPSAAPGPSPDPGQTGGQVLVKMWTSRNGGKTQTNVREKVDIGGLYFDELNGWDIQYERVVRFRGLKLRDLISQYRPVPEEIDYILLHSKRGMIIPVSITSLRNDTDVFIALAIHDDKTGKWNTSFPQGVYSQPDKGEQISLPFDNNKMVVGKNWRHTDFAITPWRFFDSLAGIEFVSSSEHYRGLDPAKGGNQIAGISVYMRRCQYCHGIGHFGARRAPDFFAVIPEKKADAVKKIMAKVLPPAKVDFGTTARMSLMPKQADFKEADAKALYEWVKAMRKVH